MTEMRGGILHVVQRHDIQTPVCVGQSQRTDRKHGSSNEVVSGDGHQLLRPARATGEEDDGHIVFGVGRLGRMNMTVRLEMGGDETKSQVLERLDNEHRSTTVQRQPVDVRLEAQNRIRLDLLDIHEQLLRRRVGRHGNYRIRISHREHGQRQQGSIGQDDHHARLLAIT